MPHALLQKYVNRSAALHVFAPQPLTSGAQRLTPLIATLSVPLSLFFGAPHGALCRGGCGLWRKDAPAFVMSKVHGWTLDTKKERSAPPAFAFFGAPLRRNARSDRLACRVACAFRYPPAELPLRFCRIMRRCGLWRRDAPTL